MAVALLDLRPQNESLKKEIDAAVARVMHSQQFILGPDVREFESELAAWLGCRFAVGVSSGTDALIMALMAMNVGPGDEVITTPYSFFATAGSIARLGAKPVFVDIDPDTFNINPAAIEDAITQKTRAIIPVHLFGQSAEIAEISSIAEKYSIPVIEDAAQAIGTSYSGVKAGALGDLACFSFFPSKNLGCFGDGGAVTTNSEELYKKLLSIRNHGQFIDKRYLHETVGGNFRIDTIQAAILRVKLPALQGWLEGRRKNAMAYQTILKELLPEKAFSEGIIKLPIEKHPAVHTYNQFVIRIPFRDVFLEEAKKTETGVMVYYPYPLHLQPCFSSLGYREGDLPESERASRESVALPIYPELPPKDLEQVALLVEKTGRKTGVW
jgi:dTDP-4-amino-4,6-dideoxygalactose transaminase